MRSQLTYLVGEIEKLLAKSELRCKVDWQRELERLLAESGDEDEER